MVLLPRPVPHWSVTVKLKTRHEIRHSVTVILQHTTTKPNKVLKHHRDYTLPLPLTSEKLAPCWVLNCLRGTNWTMSLFIFLPWLSTRGVSSASSVSCAARGSVHYCQWEFHACTMHPLKHGNGSQIFSWCVYTYVHRYIHILYMQCDYAVTVINFVRKYVPAIL